MGGVQFPGRLIWHVGAYTVLLPQLQFGGLGRV